MLKTVSASSTGKAARLMYPNLYLQSSWKMGPKRQSRIVVGQLHVQSWVSKAIDLHNVGIKGILCLPEGSTSEVCEPITW